MNNQLGNEGSGGLLGDNDRSIMRKRSRLSSFFSKPGVQTTQATRQDNHKKNRNHKWLNYALEMIPFILLSLFMTAPYMDFRQNYYPNGYEYAVVSVGHYAWNLLSKCGACVFWNSQMDGGQPAFAELLGAFLHPMVMITTLLWGVINGSKIINIVYVMISGFSMWWFAKELGVRRLSRIWISLFGVLGGHLIGRFESGNIMYALSIPSACLLFPMVLRLNKQPTNKRIAALAVLMALTWLSGEGYIQVAVVFAWFPAFLLLLYETGKKKQEKWIAFGKSLLLSGILCGILILPAGHFMVSGMDKDSDPGFKDEQPMRYLPLNLVIGDAALLGQTYLGMDTFPYAHINFIDWTPVIFALIAGYFVLQQKNKRIFGAIYFSALLAMVISSREIYVFLAPYMPFLAKLGAMGVASSMMVPPILVMAAWGLDRILDLNWPKIIKHHNQTRVKNEPVSIKLFIIIPILILSFKNIIPFDRSYLHVHRVDISTEELAYAKTNDAQWVNPPDDWIPILLGENRKIIMWGRHVTWKDRQRLAGYIGFINNPDNTVEIISQEKDFSVIRRPEEFYATVKSGDNVYKCNATSYGGIIDVTCDSPTNGVLTVLEYQFTGWYAWVDGVPSPINDGDWLGVNAPAGKHTYSFRYRPWDVYLGGFFTLLGIGLVIWLCIKKDEIKSSIVEE
jgi:hypothetical protein